MTAEMRELVTAKLTRAVLVGVRQHLDVRVHPGLERVQRAMRTRRGEGAEREEESVDVVGCSATLTSATIASKP